MIIIIKTISLVLFWFYFEKLNLLKQIIAKQIPSSYVRYNSEDKSIEKKVTSHKLIAV